MLHGNIEVATVAMQTICRIVCITNFARKRQNTAYGFEDDLASRSSCTASSSEWYLPKLA